MQHQSAVEGHDLLRMQRPRAGEGVTAAVVRAEGAGPLSEAEALAALRARLAAYKLPKRLIVVDDLPRNSMGKVEKKLLRERYASLYG